MILTNATRFAQDVPGTVLDTAALVGAATGGVAFAVVAAGAGAAGAAAAGADTDATVADGAAAGAAAGFCSDFEVPFLSGSQTVSPGFAAVF